MPESEIPKYCVKCGRNYFARYDVIDAQILLWCPSPKCREMQHTLPIFGFHSRPASQQRQIAEMIEQTESATNDSQGSEFLRVHIELAEMNDTIVPCLAEKIAGAPPLCKTTLPPIPIIGELKDALDSFEYKPLGLSEKDTQWLAQVEPPKWNELGVPPALLQPQNINMATARALNPSLDDLAAMERKIELLRRVRLGH